MGAATRTLSGAMKGIRLAILAVALLPLGRAGAEPLALRYSASWGGGPAAEIELRLEEDAAAFRNRLAIETVGLARMLSGFRAQVASEGAFRLGVVPDSYDAIWDSRKKRAKRVNMRFVPDGDGRVAEDGTFDGNDDPLLPEALRRDVLDPLTALSAIRQLIRDGVLDERAAFHLPIYDGKRRFDVHGQVRARRTAKWHDAKLDVVDLHLILRPVAGFGESAGEPAPQDEAREVEATFTRDRRAIPLRISVPIAYVPAVIMLNPKTKL